MILAALQIVLKLLGLGAWAARLAEKRADQVDGMKEQKLNDLEAAKDQDVHAAQVRDDVGVLSGRELDSELRRASTPRTGKL